MGVYTLCSVVLVGLFGLVCAAGYVCTRRDQRRRLVACRVQVKCVRRLYVCKFSRSDD